MVENKIFNELQDWGIAGDDAFRYRMLDRLVSDCDYYLGAGGRHDKHLRMGNVVDQIACMKLLWKSFETGQKPQWLPYEKILEYEKTMGIKAILVERDYKGEYERFALTPEEFETEFPETYKAFGPLGDSGVDTLNPLVHIWFEPCLVGDENWNMFFTDMSAGLPKSDIETGNLACVREDMFYSLKKYMPEPQPALDSVIYDAQSRVGKLERESGTSMIKGKEKTPETEPERR